MPPRFGVMDTNHFQYVMQAKTQHRSAGGWAAALGALAASRGEVRLLRQSWQSSQAALQQGLRRVARLPQMGPTQTLAAAFWPGQVDTHSSTV